MNNQLLADQLRFALDDCQQIPSMSTVCEGISHTALIEKAYAIQSLNTKHHLSKGKRIVGRKIGLTSLNVQKQLGVDQPDFGTLFDDMAVGDGELIDINRLIQPKIEAEIALVLKHDLLNKKHTVADIISATAYALPALEIVDSRVQDWKITLFDTISDNASSALFVLGTQPVYLSELDLPNLKMSLLEDGKVVSEGIGADCLGNPINSAKWLADILVELGNPLRAGDILMTGALGAMVNVKEKSNYTARIEGFSDVRAIFSGRN